MCPGDCVCGGLSVHAVDCVSGGLCVGCAVEKVRDGEWRRDTVCKREVVGLCVQETVEWTTDTVCLIVTGLCVC